MRPVLRCLLWLLFLALPAWCNMAAPWRSGGAVGEPAADLSGLTVESEILQIDLRPLGQLQSDQDRPYAGVEATYQIRRSGAAKSVDLVFVAPGQDGRAEVWLDGRAQSFVAETSSELPRQWKSPTHTPRPGGGKDLGFEPLRPMQVLRFNLKFDPGLHSVRVKYEVRPTARCDGSPLRYWQLAYVLAPARRWAGFGRLDAEVLLPKGWKLATSLPMQPSENGWRGHWEGVPADFLALSAQAPVPSQWPVLPVLAGLCILLPGLGGWKAGRWLGRKGRTLWWSLLLAWGMAGLSMACFLALGMGALEWMTSEPPGQSSWVWSYGQSMGVFLGSVPVAAAAWIVSQLCMVVAARRARPAA